MKANIILLLVSSLLSLIALEWVVEYWLLNIATPKQLSRYGTFEQIQESRTVMFSRDRYLQYVPAPGYKNRAGSNKHNSLGFRGDEIEVPKPDGVFRIVTVGGSTTYTSAVYDYTKSYPYLMQSLLREQGHSSVEVVNAGVVGYSSWESLINLQFRVLDLEPDIVIVYHALNDVPPRFVYPSTAYRGDNSGSREPYTPRVESFLDLSAAMRIARTELGLRKPLGGLGIARTFEFVPTNYAFQWLTQIRRGDYPSGIFAEQPAEAMVSSNRPVFYERNIRNMVAIAKEHDIEIVLATFAVSPDRKSVV